MSNIQSLVIDVIRSIWESTSISLEGMFGLAGLAVFALLFALFTLRAWRGRPFAIRPLAAAARIRTAIGRAMETGEQAHIALGVGGLGDVSTPDTLAGLYLVSYLAHRGALAEIPVRARVADPTALAGTLAVMQRAAINTGYPDVFEPTQAEFVAPTPLAYAAGTAAAIRREPMAANAMVGRFGPEVLLPVEAGAERGLTQIGGTSDPTVLPLLYGTVEAPLLGEEIYALGAAFDRPEHTGSLAAQDVFRALFAFGIVAVTLLALMGA